MGKAPSEATQLKQARRELRQTTNDLVAVSRQRDRLLAEIAQLRADLARERKLVDQLAALREFDAAKPGAGEG